MLSAAPRADFFPDRRRSAGELIHEIVRQGLLDLIELEVAAFIGADRHVDEVGRRPYAPAIGSATATATGLAA